MGARISGQVKGVKRVADYPRPQYVRSQWESLDGLWDYAFSEAERANDVTWEGDIRVPYPPESSLSGVNDGSFHPVIWYRRTFDVPEDWREERIILHFGAVDYAARVWVNGSLVVSHEGGHTPFSADITDVLSPGEQVVVVRAEDDPLDMHKPRGKQDWEREPHGIWYPRTTGIWQPVWLEPVPPTHITRVRFTPDLDSFGILVEVEVSRPGKELNLELTFYREDDNGKEEVLAEDLLRLRGTQVKRFVHFPDPGIDSARKSYLWTPETPNLIGVTVNLLREERRLDQVASYTALRTVEAREGAFLLNGRPYFLRLALDQGYWDESLLAAPSGDALRKDVELAKAMGFNGVRKHQKIEDPRYLTWADKLGLLVWEELPSAYAFGPDTVERLTREWLEVINRDHNHPCIVAWVCFNESWGVPDLPASEAQRHLVAGLYGLTKALDPSRPAIGNDGWEHVVTDLLTIHDYTRAPATLGERYGTPERSEKTVRSWLEHKRLTILPGAQAGGEPKLLSEFGGIRFNPETEEGWGYQQVENAEALLKLYAAMIRAVSGPGLAGFCYTQFADTFQEQNGLLYSDRRPKVDLGALSKATQGRG